MGSLFVAWQQPEGAEDRRRVPDDTGCACQLRGVVVLWQAARINRVVNLRVDLKVNLRVNLRVDPR